MNSLRNSPSRTSTTSATRGIDSRRARSSSKYAGINVTGTLSEQKNPMSSKHFTAPDFPAPESPVTKTSRLRSRFAGFAMGGEA
jgi:hypothetical protein